MGALAAMAVAGCSGAVPASAPPLDEGDVVQSGVGAGETGNLERLQAFLDVTQSGGDDAVRVVHHTVEGDPIYTDLSYAEGKYVVYRDTTEDANGAQERVKAAECTALVQTDRPDEFCEIACGSYSFLVADLE